MEQTPLLTADAESLRPVVLEVFGTTDPSCESRRTFDPSPKVAWMGETMAKKVLAMTERCCQTSEVFITWKTLRRQSLRWKLFLSSGVKSCGEAFPYIHIDPALEWSVSLVTEPIFLTASQTGQDPLIRPSTRTADGWCLILLLRLSFEWYRISFI